MTTDRSDFPRRSADRSFPTRRSTDRLNLSRRPFVNNRPVTRAAVLLWALGLLLLLTNVFTFWSYLESSREKRAELKDRQAAIVAERAALARREDQFSRLDLVRQNDEVFYLNGKIAQRTFSWSRLLERVAEVLPSDVRLQRLAPHGIADEREDRQVRRTANRRQQADRVSLQIDGEAKDDESLLELVDNLFAHPAFVEPNLTRETHEKGGLIRFNLDVGYLPNAVVASGLRPPPRRWKLTPEPGPSTAQAPLPPAGAVAPRASAGVPPAAPRSFGNTTVAPGTFVPPTVRMAPPGVRLPPAGSGNRPNPAPSDPLRGIGTPGRPRTPPPSEGGK